MEKEKRSVGKGAWLKVFCPEARCLTEAEIVSIPAEERKEAESGAEKGLWLEVFCPDGACLKEEERIDLPLRPSAEKEERGAWLRLFCPEGRCLIEDETDIP